MREGRFREDLYYRLGVVVIPLPPLRDREGDIPLLATTLLQRFGAEAKRKISAFTPQALRAMERYQWPGNVRELENRVKRAVIMAEGTKITPADLDLDSGPAQVRGDDPQGGPRRRREGVRPAGAQAPQRQRHPRRRRAGHQPPDDVRVDGEAGDSAGVTGERP